MAGPSFSSSYENPEGSVTVAVTIALGFGGCMGK